MPNDFNLRGSVRLIDLGLEQRIREFSAVTGRGLADVARAALKALVKYALEYTPPASGGQTGKAAQRAGEQAIVRDLGRMGFEPVTLKGYRTITTVFGHSLADPIRVPTRENPKFTDPESFRRQRLAASQQKGRAGRVSRGGSQAFYVDRRKFAPMRARLFAEVGRLASGWVAAAQELGVPVPAWIARHGGGRGTSVQVLTDGAARISLRVVNRFPEGTDDLAGLTERNIATFKSYVADGFTRQLRAYYAGKWKGSAK